jgi:hypothetical protein
MFFVMPGYRARIWSFIEANNSGVRYAPVSSRMTPARKRMPSRREKVDAPCRFRRNLPGAQVVPAGNQ